MSSDSQTLSSCPAVTSYPGSRSRNESLGTRLVGEVPGYEASSVGSGRQTHLMVNAVMSEGPPWLGRAGKQGARVDGVWGEVLHFE